MDGGALGHYIHSKQTKPSNMDNVPHLPLEHLELEEARGEPVLAPSRKRGFKGKKPKCQYGKRRKKDCLTSHRYADALPNNPGVGEEMAPEEAPPPAIILTYASVSSSRPNRERADHGWRANRAVVGLNKKLERVNKKHGSEQQMAALKLTIQRQKRSKAEKRAEREKEKKLEANLELKDEKMKRVVAEKKVSK